MRKTVESRDTSGRDHVVLDHDAFGHRLSAELLQHVAQDPMRRRALAVQHARRPAAASAASAGVHHRP
jgi:hypothetical protein